MQYERRLEALLLLPLPNLFQLPSQLPIMSAAVAKPRAEATRRRRAHAKSRKGCGNCKLRRVKVSSSMWLVRDVSADYVSAMRDSLHVGNVNSTACLATTPAWRAYSTLTPRGHFRCHSNQQLMWNRAALMIMLSRCTDQHSTPWTLGFLHSTLFPSTPVWPP